MEFIRQYFIEIVGVFNIGLFFTFLKVFDSFHKKQTSILGLLRQSEFVKEIKAFREHYEEKEIILQEKHTKAQEESEREMKGAQQAAEISQENLENILSALNIPLADHDNINEIVEDSINKRISSNMSFLRHQLRSPISNLVLSPSLVIDLIKKGETNKAIEILNEIKSISTVLKFTIESFDIDYLEKNISIESLSINNELMSLLNSLSSILVSRNISCKVKKIPDIKVLADKRITQIILFEMLDNAVTYSERNSSIEIDSIIDEESNLFSLVISNSGLPIDAHQTQHVFKKGFRGSEAVRHAINGAGNGLYVAKKISNSQGGDVELISGANPVKFKISFAIQKNT